jgi:hypothetical protein
MANALRFSLEGTCGLCGGFLRRVALSAALCGDEGGDWDVGVRLERAGELAARRGGAEAESASLLLSPAAAPRRRSCELGCSVCSVRALSPPPPHAGASAVDSTAGEDGTQDIPSRSATWLGLAIG